MQRACSIEGFENYSITDEGEVFNSKGRKLKPFKDKYGYLTVGLFKQGMGHSTKKFMIHILVAKHFIPNPENKPTVNHKDGDKENCKSSNLEWMTRSEQMYHSWANGLHNNGREGCKCREQ